MSANVGRSLDLSVSNDEAHHERFLYVVYILYSEKFNKIYIGFTHDLENRFKSHNELGKKGWTIKFRPWIVLYKEEFVQKPEAMSREKELKSANGREFVWKLVKAKYP